MIAPFDVRLGADTVLEPDLLVARRVDVEPEAGCPSYWTIEPDPPEDAWVSGDQSWTSTAPFPVTVVPAELLDD